MHVDSNGLSGVGACAERENREGEGGREIDREREREVLGDYHDVGHVRWPLSH